MVVPNFFNGGTLSKVGQLASCLRGVRAVAWVQFLDHGKVDDVGGFVLNTLWKRVKNLNYIGGLSFFGKELKN